MLSKKKEEKIELGKGELQRNFEEKEEKENGKTWN